MFYGKRDRYPKIWFTGTAKNSGPVFETFRNLSGKRKNKDTPILLLDDVLSELDSNRQTYLLDSIHDIQTLITCTGLDDFVSHQFHINKVFKVVKGEVFNPVN